MFNTVLIQSVYLVWSDMNMNHPTQEMPSLHLSSLIKRNQKSLDRELLDKNLDLHKLILFMSIYLVL